MKKTNMYKKKSLPPNSKIIVIGRRMYRKITVSVNWHKTKLTPAKTEMDDTNISPFLLSSIILRKQPVHFLKSMQVHIHSVKAL